MTDNRKSGIALIVGSVLGISTMVVHPTPNFALTPDGYQHLAVVSAVAHSLGLASLVVLFVGACGLTARLRAADRLALVALVTYAVGSIAALIAAAVSGWIEPNLMLRMSRDTGTATPHWRIVIAALFEMNQTFARIFTAASFVGVVLWSVTALRQRDFIQGLATYGCIVPPAIGLLMVVGHLRMDVHGMMAVVLAQSIWFVGVGWRLYRYDTAPSS